MLNTLQIKQFAIIEELELEFENGFSVLSGETGAGKSILFDALGLLLGARADASMIRNGEDKADINAAFNLNKNHAAQDWLAENDLDSDEDCLLRRLISASGRSRAYINGNQVPVQQLKELGALLIDIHGQHSQHRLMKSSEQLNSLDAYAAHEKLLNNCQEYFNHWQTCQKEYTELKKAADERQSRLDFLNFQLAEFNGLELKENEVANLERESKELSLGTQHLETLRTSYQLLNDEEAANTLLGRANTQLQELAGKDTRFKELAETLETAYIQAAEVASELNRHLDSAESDPERESWLNDRLGTIHTLARKHRVESTGLYQFEQDIRSEYDNLVNADSRLEALEKKLNANLSDYLSASKILSASRQKAAKKLQKEITDSVQQLGMPEAKFEIAVNFSEESSPKASGQDVIEYLFSANPGQKLDALKKIASGGELSRVGLAIAVTCQQQRSAPSVIFDEVDAGIGGVTANKVAEYLHQLGEQYQVLCVTHLAQVAAKADQQYRVMKMTDGKTTHTNVRLLSKDERVNEIVRMLGSQDSDKELTEHAKKLLKN